MTARNETPLRRRSRGRPPDRSKDEAILRAAGQSFLERGLSGSSIEHIAAQAGVSKMTVYKRFADKMALFEEIIRAERANIVCAVERALVAQGTLAERLNALGLALMRQMFNPRHLLLDRIFRRDLAQVPGSAQSCFDSARVHCRELIAAAAAAGEIDIDDPLLAAVDLIGLWRGFLVEELVFGVREGTEDDDLRSRVERGTRLFFKMNRPMI